MVDKEEYEYNYSDFEKNFIKDYFKDHTILIFDLQFKNSFFLKEFLKDFKNFVKKNHVASNQENEMRVLYSDSEME
ncbi:hypothetical protein [Chryseobacterium sp. Leaf405]|uniref:hypothetical protein n=1 Tax=Chryseobacterium sp. Leaf405 TaxID=1736367 RepID=UPI00103BB74F|nr:hypothetical protein [Chryseobacterium sp. Leaf405]